MAVSAGLAPVPRLVSAGHHRWLVGFMKFTLPLSLLLGTLQSAVAGPYVFTKIVDNHGPIPSNSYGFPAIDGSGTVFFGIGSIVVSGSGGPITFVIDPNGPLTGIGYVAVNQHGEIVFNAQTRNSDIEGVYRLSGGVIETIADNTGHFANFDITPAINSSGTVAFGAQFRDGSLGLYMNHRGSTTTIIESSDLLGLGTPVINAAGTVVFHEDRPGSSDANLTFDHGAIHTIAESSPTLPHVFAYPSINDHGTVVFGAQLDPNGDEAVFTASGGLRHTIVDTTGAFSSFDSWSINNMGVVAFRAYLRTGGNGVFTGPDPVADKVIATGDPLFGSTVSNGGVGFLRGLNDSGQIAFEALLTDGTVGVYRADPTSPLTVSLSGTGQGVVRSDPAGIDCDTECAHDFARGTVVRLSAVPGLGSVFAGWSGGTCSGAGPNCVLRMDSAKAVTARFSTAPPVRLSVRKAGTGTGTITSAPPGINCGTNCSVSFAVGTTVALTAAPAIDSAFTGWTGGGCTGGNVTCTVMMAAAKTITATFTNFRLTVRRSGTGSGIVNSTLPGIDCGLDCTKNYPPGSGVVLSANPLSGSGFTGWSGACTGTGNCSVSMTAARAVTAHFTTFTLRVSSTGTGTITSTPLGIDCRASCQRSYAPGSVIQLTATPDPNSGFVGWSGACSGIGTCTVAMTAARQVTARFATYTLRVTKAGNGNGSVSSTPEGISCGSHCTGSYAPGTVVELTAAPLTGSVFGGWSGGCTGTGTCRVTMNAARTVSATFRRTQNAQ